MWYAACFLARRHAGDGLVVSVEVLVMKSLRAPIAALFAALPFMAACNGCGGGNLVCDSAGNCQICDAYGCHDANKGTTGSTASGSGGTGSASTGSNATTTTGTGSTSSGAMCNAATEVCDCVTKSDCPSNLYCLGGHCLAGCDHDFQCGAGKVCANGECVVGCSATSPCVTGYTCVSGACEVDTSHPECTTAADCGGMPCVGGLCTTSCTTNTDCGEGKLCDASTHTCFTDPTPKPLCGGSMMCPGVGQVCLADGYCHYPCNTLNDCKLIDNRFVACDMMICKTQEEINPQCDLSNPCPMGQNCISNKCI